MRDAKDTRAPSARLLRLAQECLKLADECERGTAPKMVAGDFSAVAGRCALGWVLSRSIDGGDPWDALPYIGDGPVRDYERRVQAASHVVIVANNNASDADRPAAVITPLRALAAALSGSPVTDAAEPPSEKIP